MATTTASSFKRLLGIAFIASVPVMAAGAAYVFRLRCENFGCMGLGVAWFGWSVVYAVAFGLGLLMRTLLDAGSALRSAVSMALCAQVLMGVLLAGYWLLHGSP
jgi:hypothetical protein